MEPRKVVRMRGKWTGSVLLPKAGIGSCSFRICYQTASFLFESTPCWLKTIPHERKASIILKISTVIF
jgi:hypothetical protein